MKSKTTGDAVVFLFPAPDGWCLRLANGEATEAPDLARAAAALAPSGGRLKLHLALPTRLAILERFTLPSVDPAELDGMARLQLEKTVPYPLEETTYGFEIVARTATEETEETSEAEGGGPPPESAVVACAVHNPALETLCAPLLQHRRCPERLTLWAAHVAAQAPSAGAACGLWREGEEAVFGVFEEGKLSFAEVIAPAGELAARLPRALLGAELAGVSTRFCAVLLDPALEAFREEAARLTGAPVEALRFPSPREEEGLIDLTPAAWRAEMARQARRRRLGRRLALAGCAYAAFLLLLLGSIAVRGHRLKAVKNRLAAAQPQVDAIIARRARWESLAPAVDSRRFTVELLYQAFTSLPSPEVRITRFNQTPGQFMIEGEAPGASQAVGFEEKLKAQPALDGFHFDAAPPVLLPNEHAQFRIYGK